MTDIFQYLRNWFDRNQPKFYGKFKIEEGVITSINDGDMGLKTNQFYRIIGSSLNDGVYQYGKDVLVDEDFDGAVWLMGVPNDVRQLVTEIDMWVEKYGGIDSTTMSPFQSESFAGYSYSKASGAGSSASAVPTWQSVFADRLGRYKKL